MKRYPVQTRIDERGRLGIVEFSELPFTPQRMFYIYKVPPGVTRGGHAHLLTEQALFCLSGTVTVDIENEHGLRTFLMSRQDRYLYVAPRELVTMRDFSSGCVLLVLASEPYDAKDYLYATVQQDSLQTA